MIEFLTLSFLGLWLLGMMSGYTGGWFIHIFLAMGLVLLLIRLAVGSQRRYVRR